MSNTERSGWRDESISNRHRKWGLGCPAFDLDFVLCEYDRGQPVALVEYKHELAARAHSSHSTYRALSKLGSNSMIPVFGVRYNETLTEFHATALNEIARKMLGTTKRTMNEKEYVALLYALRKQDVPPEVFSELNIPI